MHSCWIAFPLYIELVCALKWPKEQDAENVDKEVVASRDIFNS